MDNNETTDTLEELIRQKLSDFLEQTEDCELEALYPLILSQVEKPLIELTLKRSYGNQLQAARILGINRNTLRKKIQELGIHRSISGFKRKSRNDLDK